jgi:alcohol dehydrogenase
MLPHVVRWNSEVADGLYADLLGNSHSSGGGAAGERLAARLEALARYAGLPRSLRELGAAREDLKELAGKAAQEWTGTFNPRPFDADGAVHLYEAAF